MKYLFPSLPLTTEALLKTMIYVSGLIEYDRENAVVFSSPSQYTEGAAIWSSRVMFMSGVIVIWVPAVGFSAQMMDIGSILQGSKPTIIGIEKGASVAEVIVAKTAMFRRDILVFESDVEQAKEQIDIYLNKLTGE